MYEYVLLGEEHACDLLFSPKLVVDAGAIIGMASIYFARTYPEAKIFAIEPEAANFAALVKSTRPYPAIVPNQAAHWNRDGQICFGEPDAGSGFRGEWAFVTREDGAGAKVRAITMRTLGKGCAVDIEGAKNVQ